MLELDPLDSGFTDFFVISSGSNTRQTEAIADEIELRLKREYGAYPQLGGRAACVAEWILLDYVDFVIHIFLEEKRVFYDIERLRKSARKLDLEELKAALTKKTLEARNRPAAKRSAAKSAAKTAALAGKTAKKSGKAAPKKPVAKKKSAAGAKKSRS